MGQQNTVQMRMNRVSVLSQAFQAARTAPAGVAAIVSNLDFQRGFLDDLSVWRWFMHSLRLNGS